MAKIKMAKIKSNTGKQVKGNFHRPEGAGNFDNMDDNNVVRSINIKNGTVDLTPTDDKHIVNKKYVDDNDFWDRTGTQLTPKVSGDDIQVDDTITLSDNFNSIFDGNAHPNVAFLDKDSFDFGKTDSGAFEHFVSFKYNTATEKIEINDSNGLVTPHDFMINVPVELTGQLSMGDLGVGATVYGIKNVLDPVADQDAATKKYVDDENTAQTLETVTDAEATTPTTTKMSLGISLPSTISGLKEWFKADAITGLNDNDPVATWADSSGFSNNATATGTAQPTYKTNQINGHPTVRFDGSTDMLGFTRDSTIRTVFWVCFEDVGATDNTRQLLGDSSNYDFARGFGKVIWDTTWASNFVKNGVTRINGIAVNGITTIMPTTASVISLVTTGNTRSNQITRDRAIAGRDWQGDIAEIIIYNVALTDEEIKQVEGYLNNKYNLNSVGLNVYSDINIAGGHIQTPEDLEIACGTEKTIILTEPVYKDINVGAAVLARPAASQPDEDNFLDEAGADTGITTLAYAIGEKASGSFEMQHDYKEGSDFTFHAHWQGITAPSGTDNVQFRLTYTLMRDGETLDAVTTIDSADTPFDTQYEGMRTDIVVIDGATAGIGGGGVKIGDQLLFTLERVASTGDAYAGDALVATVGIHYQVDTLGSRTIITK